MYNPIENYGIVGDLHSCALIGTNGSIDWCCLPRFDSPSVFARLLDDVKGGHFQIRPRKDGYKVSQRYIPNTAILETTFKVGSSVFTITDFMPVLLSREGHRHVIIRVVKALRGSNPITVSYDPRPGYAKGKFPTRRIKSGGLITRVRGGFFELHSPQGLSFLNGRKDFTFSLAKGEERMFMFLYRDTEGKHIINLNHESVFEETKKFWEEWVAKGIYMPRYRDELIRSAITLKLMQFRPEGSLIAAPTTSIPEQIGGERNWDYRYSWMRDGTFTLYAFYVLGYDQEARDFFNFIEQTLQNPRGDLKHFYTITGGRVPRETKLTHLKGYMDSKPVRIGNNAIAQTQNDTFGSVIDAYYFMNKKGVGITHHTSEVIISLASRIEKAWNTKDQSIWEVRSGARHFTYTKVLSWVGLDRAIRLAANLHKVKESHIGRWKRLRAEIYTDIWKKSWDPKRKVFRRSYDEDGLDATNLLFPLLQFMHKYDDATRTTVMQTWMEYKSKEDDALIYRYKARDGLKGEEGAFLLCSFWLISSLALIGEVKTATRLMNQIMKYRNHLGLFSEEVDAKTGKQLGNFPQAFSHVGFIMATYYIDHYTERYKGKK